MAWDWDKLQGQKKGAQGGRGAPPPGIDEILEKFRGARGKYPGGIWIVIILVALIIVGYSCVWRIDTYEIGVVQRFGKYNREATPGINWTWPIGIEKMTKVKGRDYVFNQEFGVRTLQSGVRTRYASSTAYLNESLMLTGDLNVAVVPWIVQYRINDPYKYLFKVRNVEATLRDLAESTMRLVVGDRSIDEVISKRKEIAADAKILLQKELDEAETGFKVKTIEMKTVTVPEPVKPSWNEVNQATQERQQIIEQARAAYNKIIPAAKGQAEKTIKAAEGYALDRVNRAKGDTARFLALYKEYSKAPDVTLRRLYLETILDVFPKLGKKYIVDANQRNLLPLLNLGKPEGGPQ